MNGRTIKRGLASKLTACSLHELVHYRATFAENDAREALTLCDAIGIYIYGREYEAWIPKTESMHAR